MTSDEDEKKRLRRLWDKLIGKNGYSQSRGTPPRADKKHNPLDRFRDDPKRDGRI